MFIDRVSAITILRCFLVGMSFTLIVLPSRADMIPCHLLLDIADYSQSAFFDIVGKWNRTNSAWDATVTLPVADQCFVKLNDEKTEVTYTCLARKSDEESARQNARDWQNSIENCFVREGYDLKKQYVRSTKSDDSVSTDRTSDFTLIFVESENLRFDTLAISMYEKQPQRMHYSSVLRVTASSGKRK